MISGKATLSGNWRILSRSREIFGRAEMQQLADFGLRTVKARIARGIGSDDVAMPPLKTVGLNQKGKPRRIKYNLLKQREGIEGIRNMRGPGPGPHMMDLMQVASVSDRDARIAFMSQDAKKKAAINEHRTPFIGWSRADTRAVVEYTEKLFQNRIRLLLSDGR